MCKSSFLEEANAERTALKFLFISLGSNKFVFLRNFQIVTYCVGNVEKGLSMKWDINTKQMEWWKQQEVISNL